MSIACRSCCFPAISLPTASPILSSSRSRISATARCRPMTASGRFLAISTGFADQHGIHVVETQAGKSSLPFTQLLSMGAIGVTGTSAANMLCEEADVVLAAGTRLQYFTTGSWALFKNPDKKLIGLNVQPFDAAKHRALPLIADARVGLEEISADLGNYKAPASWTEAARNAFKIWMKDADAVTAPTNATPSDAQVIGALQRALGPDISMICASGGLPGE